MIQQYLKKLNEERLSAWEEGKAVLDAAVNDRREMTPDERTKWDAIDKRISDLDAEIKGWQDRERREREAAEARTEYEKFVRPADLDQRDKRAEDDLSRFIRGELRRMDVDLTGVAREKAALRAGARGQEFRDLMKVTGAAGGTTVPVTFVRELYDYLEVYTGVRQLNVTVITTSSGENMDFPTVTSHGTAAIVGEGSALAEADPAFGKVTLGAYKYGQLLQISTELATDTGVDLMGFIARDTARAIGRATDIHYATGSGTNQPQGITSAGYGTVTAGGTGVGGSATYANLISMIYGINREYRAMSPQWFTLDASVAALRGMVDTTGRPLWEPSFQLGQPDRFLGYPIVDDPNVPAMGTGLKWLYFGDFSPFMIRDVGSIRFERSDEYAFNTDLITFRTIFRTDSRNRDVRSAVAFIGGAS